MRNVDYSESLTFTNGDKRQFKLSFLKPKGPRGGRNVISKLRLRCVSSLTTNASTTIAAGGLANICQQVRIVGPMGEFVNLTGPEIRMLHISEKGKNAIPDAALVAISQTGTARTIEFILDFAPVNRSKRRWDFALPVDHLLSVGDQALEVKGAANTDMGTGGGTTIVSQAWQLVVESREEPDIQDHCWRELRSVAQNQLTDFELPVSGGIVRNCFAFKYSDHITGGTDMSSCTSVQIPSLGVDAIDPTYLQNAFLDEGDHDRSSTSDPFVQTTRRVLPLIWSSFGEKLTDMPRHTSKLAIRLTGNSVSNLSLVTETIYEKTAKATQVEAGYAAEHGLTGRTIKTEGKTKKDPSGWGWMKNFFPGKLTK